MTAASLNNLNPAIRWPPPKRYKVGELAQATGLTRQTLHNYTRWGLIREVAWTDGGHRLYDESVFLRLGRIMQLKPINTMDQIRQILADDESRGAA
jgi:DNA-binding transcriptional MerR regulator